MIEKVRGFEYISDSIVRPVRGFVIKYILKDPALPCKDALSDKKLFTVLFWAVLAWYLIQAVYFALNIKLGIPPDEIHHYSLIHFYRQIPGIFIKDSIETYPFGAVSAYPYLYQLVMGKLLYLNVFQISDSIYLRFLNIGLGVLSFIYLYYLAKEITKDGWVQLAALFTATNLMMYAFLSGSVNYDNLINLLAVMSIFHLIRFLKNHSRPDLLAVFFTMAAGSLTKITYPPLVIIELVILLINSKDILRNRDIFLKGKIRALEAVLSAVIIILAVLNANLYGNNIIKYHQVFPSADKVISYDNAMKYYPQFSRDVEFNKTIGQREIEPFFKYVKEYTYFTEASIFGILAHRGMMRTGKDLILFNVFIMVSFILFLLNIRNYLSDKNILVLFSLSSAYIIVLFCFQYVNYLSNRFAAAGLQGRYNFPVLSGIAVLFGLSYMNRFNSIIKLVLSLILVFVLITGGFLFFLNNADAGWFNHS